MNNNSSRTTDSRADTFGDDSRAATNQLGYILNLGVVTILLVGLAAVSFSLLGVIDDTDTGDQLDDISVTTSSDLQGFDREVRLRSDTATLTETISLDDTVNGERYVIEIYNRSTIEGNVDPPDDLRFTELCDRPCVVVATQSADIVVQNPFETAKTTPTTRVDGGELTLEWDSVNEQIRIEEVTTD